MTSLLRLQRHRAVRDPLGPSGPPVEGLRTWLTGARRGTVELPSPALDALPAQPAGKRPAHEAERLSSLSDDARSIRARGTRGQLRCCVAGGQVVSAAASRA